jgi:signal transduction histidine kinase
MDNEPRLILLVEDNPADVRLLYEALQTAAPTQFNLLSVERLSDALARLAERQFVVILLDLSLPDSQGLDTLRQVQTYAPQAPIVVLTGLDDEALAVAAVQEGAQDYLVKGDVEPRGLVRALRYAVERHALRQALRQLNEELEARVQERTAQLMAFNVALQQEMAEHQRAEEQLRRSERLAAIGTTVAKLAHEIGNPLNGMSTSLQLLERYLAQGKATDDLLAEIVQDLHGEIHRLQSLLQDLRIFHRPQLLSLRPTNLAVMAAEVLRTQASHYIELGIRLEQSLPVELPSVRADSDKLAQVLLNLYKNAVEAMPEGGVLTIRGTYTEEQVRLEVEDTGIGIPEQVDIFEPFVSNKAEGTGLGLAIVKQIVEAHGGTLTYKSAPGQGTTMALTLPVHKEMKE